MMITMTHIVDVRKMTKTTIAAVSKG